MIMLVIDVCNATHRCGTQRKIRGLMFVIGRGRFIWDRVRDQMVQNRF